MSQSVMLLVAILLSAGLTYLMTYLEKKSLSAVLDDQRKQIQELLNRIQSNDIHTFATMQANTNPPVSSDEPMYPRSDEAEARRMVEMYGGVEGIGDVIYDQEDQDLLSDLGFRG